MSAHQNGGEPTLSERALLARSLGEMGNAMIAFGSVLGAVATLLQRAPLDTPAPPRAPAVEPSPVTLGARRRGADPEPGA